MQIYGTTTLRAMLMYDMGFPLCFSYVTKKRTFDVEYIVNSILGGLVSITGMPFLLVVSTV